MYIINIYSYLDLLTLHTSGKHAYIQIYELRVFENFSCNIVSLYLFPVFIHHHNSPPPGIHIHLTTKAYPIYILKDRYCEKLNTL